MTQTAQATRPVRPSTSVTRQRGDVAVLLVGLGIAAAVAALMFGCSFAVGFA